MSSALRNTAYLLVAALGAFELLVLGLVLNPDVPPDYRAYYIDATTTCLNQPVSGDYPGGVISFLPEGRALAKPLKVCGWEGPAGDGTHAVGTSSRLRFVVREALADPALMLDLIAVNKPGIPTQRVNILVNGQHLDDVIVGPQEPTTVTLPLPPELVAESGGRYDVTLEFPDATKMGQTDPRTRWRSIKLLAAGITDRPSA